MRRGDIRERGLFPGPLQATATGPACPAMALIYRLARGAKV